jgi:hypothetical protein
MAAEITHSGERAHFLVWVYSIAMERQFMELQVDFENKESRIHRGAADELPVTWVIVSLCKICV